ncbi:acetoacetate decarboxylase family protein [Nocardioides sp. ChNu-153]|uniref:acetoacetate decarboxylase family protein n=1 Tax=unclassified Nocardioides TaxID=2615069 RepID=UPI002404D508|nr:MULTISPECIES: acetoacetate decarboxylase family protein [unclassified Nocardioides]MDF9715537.1 acetoacetate decarboxylase family protein [Nocardioides sp. ChNu-99]MDN7120708.1 acetoacetate decarboxylase family protein [Nocardioides sp. ChNu-153]
MSGYPPQPWDLTGRGWISAWRVRGSLPPLPAGVRPVGRVALTMFVDYRPPGQMTYGELLAGVLVRSGARVGLAITDIWVDSPASRDGGRALWGVPKNLASFPALGDGALEARRDGTPLARATFRPGRLPGVPLPFPATAHIAQTLPVGPPDAPGAATVWTPVRASARSVRLARATWESPADGPLAWLTGARPLASVRVDGFAMRFGA